MESAPLISREFLEEALGRKVESFSIKAGTNVGDNFMSVIYAIDVDVKIQEDNNDSKTENLHILSKCYPSHPGRQDFLNKTNAFWNELCVYKILIPEFDVLAKKFGFRDTVLFPPFVAGRALNFKKELEGGEAPIAGKVFGPFDNYVMMTDMRKTHGFRMADRTEGLDIDQTRLVIAALARIHAISWAYKQIHGISDLSTEFDFLSLTLTEEDKKMWIGMMASNALLAASTIEDVLGKHSAIADGTRKLSEIASVILETGFSQNSSAAQQLVDAYRIKPAETVPEELWTVLLHGDCWTNNLLFRFDEGTLKALEVVLVDLQCMRENCPTLDLVNLIYTSTSTELRKAHLSDLLQLYHERFSAYCEAMGVAALPNFTLPELTKRFQRSKLYGCCMAVTFLPAVTTEGKDMGDLDKTEGDAMADVMKVFTERRSYNAKYANQIVALAKEMYEEGVI